MAKNKLILVGGGGHCKSCIDVIEAEGRFKISGIVDIQERLQQRVLDYKVIASDPDLPKLVSRDNDFLITIGSIKDPGIRIEKFEYLKRLGARFPVVISPLARVSNSTGIGEGTIVMHQAIVNSDAGIGRNCIINTLALIEHDVQIGDHCHVSTGSILNGRCGLGNRVFLGSNSVVVNDVNIADDVVIGAGSVVTRSIGKAGTYVGNPARIIKKRS